MKNVRTALFSIPLSLSICAGSLAAVGCGGSVEQPQTQASAVTKAPVAPQTHGVVKVFGDALGEVALRPDQRTELEKIAALAEQRHAAMADGKKELMLAVADQVERGAIDRTALQPQIDRIVADLEKGRPEDTASLARMHAILDPEQRNAFADALEAKLKSGHHGKAKGEAGDHAGGAKGMHGMMQLAEDLELTDDQKSQIKGALEAGREGHSMREAFDRMSEGKRVLESFRTDKFDASVVTPAPEKLRARAAIGTSRALGVAEKILPILTPDQRKLAAEKLRTMANSGAEVPSGH